VANRDQLLEEPCPIPARPVAAGAPLEKPRDPAPKLAVPPAGEEFLEKKCWLLAAPDLKLDVLATRAPKLAPLGATGRAPRIILALRSMLSLTGVECDMRPLAKSCEETCITALRIRSSVITRSRFEPKGRPPGVVNPVP